MNRRGGRQGGWVGMIAVLLALLIVAWLARDALKQYALVPRSDAPAESAPPTGYQRSPRGVVTLRTGGAHDAHLLLGHRPVRE